ncbi:MAG: hypothetical protein DRN95_03085 [Candidatus Hydrothermarchaeota archaeon]|nr:MAG: hypothetical protein DRN95_03085 [Candidatus Hydrothermarchaeota archaeon]
MSKVTALFLLLTFLFIGSSHAIEVIDEPALTTSLALHVTFSGKVSTPSEMKRIEINMSFPQSCETQRVTTDEKLAYDKLGNQILHIVKENPQNPFYYSASAYVETSSFNLYSLPENYALTDYERKFLEATPNIQSNSYEIQKLAEDITKACENDFEKIAKLAIWVNEHIEYDLSYGDKNYDALWVLNNRRGVCSEYTTLFAALARAIGVPVRYVGGYAYGRKGWEPHAYAEVFLGRWVPVDTLWLQVGYLDATHIKMSIGKDNQVEDNIEILGYNVKNVKWEKNEPVFDILKANYREREKDFELFASSSRLNPGDEFLVVWRYLPKQYGVAELRLEPCIGNAIEEIHEKERRVILEPGREAIAVWRLKINKNLKHGYLYTCPLTLNSNFFEFRILNITIDTARTFKKIGMKAEVLNTEVELGDEQVVSVDVSVPLGIRGKVGIIYGNQVKEVEVSKNEKLSFSFFPKLGENKVYIYTSTGDVVEIPFKVIENRDFSIKIEAPKFLKVNQDRKLKIFLTNNRETPLKINLTIIEDGEKTTKSLEVIKSEKIERDIRFSDTGDRIIKIILDGKGIKSTKLCRIRVYTKPEVDISLLQYDRDKKLAKFKILVSKDKALNISIKINGNLKTIEELEGEEVITFKGIEEVSPATLCYYDLGGERYCESIEVKSVKSMKSIIQRLLKIFHTFYELFIKRFVK